MSMINARNINEAFQIGIMNFQEWDVKKNKFKSRYGDVIRAPHPVTTLYRKPRERVLFHEERDCNPFFHLMESLWMLNGSRDVHWLMQFNKKMFDFSDDGEIYHGAYGYRWRKDFGFDQLEYVVKELKEQPESRRAVLQIWDCKKDLNKTSKDIPCNIMAIFDIVNDKLNISVLNRSNDMIWGAYGANVVQFSMLQEYIAGMLGKEVGVYYQISVNFHVYLETFEKFKDMKGISEMDEYTMHDIKPYPLITQPAYFDNDLQVFMDGDYKLPLFHNSFFNDVALPVFNAWQQHKNKKSHAAIETLDSCLAEDWRIACTNWIKRRIK
jgi:thymidylate synthase